MSTRVLITGAGGFTGWHLARLLRSRDGINIVGTDVDPAPQHFSLFDQYVCCDIRNRSTVKELVSDIQPDWVFHLAGIVSGDVHNLFLVNTLGSVHLFDALVAACPHAKVLVVGSAAEYGPVSEAAMPISESYVCQPDEPYGISKFAMTRIALHYYRTRDLNVVVARPFNIIGAGVPRSLLVGALVERVQKASAEGLETVKVGNLFPKRDFVDVHDVVNAYVKILEGDYGGHVFNICSGKATSIQEVVDMLLSLATVSLRLEVDPKLVRPFEAETVYGSFSKAQASFGFMPSVSLERSLRAAWEHVQAGRN